MLGGSGSGSGNECGRDVSLIPPQQRASLAAVRKMLLRWASLQLQTIVVECKRYHYY